MGTIGVEQNSPIFTPEGSHFEQFDQFGMFHVSADLELEQALERVSQRVVAEQLCVLDSSIGFSVSRLVLTKFQLLRSAAPKEAEVIIESEPEFAQSAPLTLAAHANGNGDGFEP